MQVNVAKHSTILFEKEIARLNKRAHKVGVPLITFARVGEVVLRRTSITVMDGEESQRTYPVDCVRYEVAVPACEEYAWALMATITPIEGGKPFVDVHMGKTVDTAYWEQRDPCRCEHCNTTRHRNLTYVVMHKQTGEHKQVGRQCFKDYVGHEGLAKLEFQALVVSMLGNGDEDFMFPGGTGRVEVISVREVVEMAEAIADADGCWKNNQKDDYGQLIQEGTHRKAVAALTRSQMLPNREQVNQMLASGAIQERVQAALEEIRAIEFNGGEEDEFGRSLQYCANFDVVPVKKARLVAYLCQFLRNRKARLERQAKKATMVHVGTVGKREVFSNLRCFKVISRQTDFGPSYLNLFVDPAGNELVWKTGTFCAEEGESYTLKGTVKEHKEYNGAKQTILSRCVEV